MTRCIHNACKIRDKAQRPSAFKSQPSGRLTCSTPELGAQLNLTNDQKRRKAPYLQACPFAWSCEHVRHVVSLLSSTQKRSDVVAASSYAEQSERWKKWKPSTAASCSTHWHRQMRKGKGWGPVQRPAVQHNDIGEWDKEKKAGCSLYLNELLIQKCKFRHRFTVHS